MCNFECIAKMRDIFEEKLIFCGKEFRTSSNKNYSYVAINLTFSPFVAKKKNRSFYDSLRIRRKLRWCTMPYSSSSRRSTSFWEKSLTEATWDGPEFLEAVRLLTVPGRWIAIAVGAGWHRSNMAIKFPGYSEK